MDARAAAFAAQVTVGTLNSWIQRGIIPGVSVGAQGRLRDFDLDVATAIGIICELVRHGLSAPRASKIAETYLNEKPRPNRLMLAPLVEFGNLRQNNIEIGVHGRFDSEQQLPKIIQDMAKMGIHLPSYMILNVQLIVETMRAAEERWQQAQRKSGHP